MLDLGKRYFVSAGCYPRSVIEAWANENTMKLIGEDVDLPTCRRVYELDVQYNEDLVVQMRLLGSGRPNFLNGTKVIGNVCYDNAMGETRMVIYPAIRDR